VIAGTLPGRRMGLAVSAREVSNHFLENHGGRRANHGALGVLSTRLILQRRGGNRQNSPRPFSWQRLGPSVTQQIDALPPFPSGTYVSSTPIDTPLCRPFSMRRLGSLVPLSLMRRPLFAHALGRLDIPVVSSLRKLFGSPLNQRYPLASCEPKPFSGVPPEPFRPCYPVRFCLGRAPSLTPVPRHVCERYPFVACAARAPSWADAAWDAIPSQPPHSPLRTEAMG
jgi:hypothetical protein